MKGLRKSLPELYAQWVNTGWTILTGRPPEPPAAQLPPKDAQQAAANQEWEDEGGSVKPRPKI